MKKFTLMLIAVLMAAVSFAGTPVRKQVSITAPRTMTAKRHFVPQRKATPVSMPTTRKAASKMKKAVRQAAPRKVVSSIDDLTGKRMLYSMYCVFDDNDELKLAEPEMGGTPVTITKGSGTTLEIEGFTSDATEKIVASVDFEEGTISIADGQTLLTDEEYGAIILCNCEEEGAPITGSINEDGTIDFDQLWAPIISEGEYQGYPSTDFYYYSGIVDINGTMKWSDEDGAYEEDLFIYVDEEDPKSVNVFNFAGEETMVVVTLKEDHTFFIDNQLIWDGGDTYGKFYTYGITDDGENVIDLTGKGTDTVLTFDCYWSIYAPSSGYWWGLLSPATITLTDGSTFTYPNIPDVAAMPADPAVVQVNAYDAEEGYGSVFMSIPAVDVDGNELKEDKLFYTLYADVAGEVSQITFTPEICEKLTEALTEVPYSFTDNWDFQYRDPYKVIFLNYDFSDYDRIGVQSIYYGGGECNKTEIQWFENEQPDPNGDFTFDFNSMDVPTSMNGANDGDITEELTLTEGSVTLAISPKAEGSSTENRFWASNKGPQLRVYSGTLTFTVPEEYSITQMVFNAGKWNEGNNASNGEFGEYADNEVTWTGDAQEVIVYVAGNSQINSITVTVGEGGETPPDIDTDPIVPPAGLVTSTYMFKSMYFQEDEEDDEELVTANLVEYEDQVLVGFDNNDVYIQGLCDYVRDGWVKGTKNADGKYEIPAGQYMGSYDYAGMYTIDFFFTAVDDNDNLIPAVLTIDPETGVISSDQVMAINLDTEALDYYMLFNGMHLAELQEIAAVPADPTIVDFILDDEDEDEIYVMIELNIPAKSVSGDDLIMAKMAYQFFIEKDGEVQPLVFPASLYDYLDADATEIPYSFEDDWDFYRGGAVVYLNQPLDEIKTWKKIGVKSINYAGGETNESNIAWLDLTAYWGEDYDGIARTTTAGDVRYFDLTGRATTANQKGILVKQVRHQDGSVTTTKVLRK